MIEVPFMTKDTKSKVYQEVLEEIRNYIVDHQLQDGDRLPSERELAEQLNAGRSSVREALRAIELLCLIETRHGEGTFLRSYQPYYSVEILSTFILQETRSQQEVLQLKLLLESQVLSNLSGQISTDLYEKLLSVIVELPKEQLHTFLFTELFNAAGNRLLSKIWHLLEGFSNPIPFEEQNHSFYEQILLWVKENKTESAKEALKKVYILE